VGKLNMSSTNETGIHWGGSSYVLGFQVVEGSAQWADVRNVIETLSSDWRMSGQGWGNMNISVSHRNLEELVELRGEIVTEWGSYILFEEEEEE